MVDASITQYPILFFNANAFRKVFYILLKDSNLLGTESNTISAILVNGLLSAELYLKYLVCFDQENNTNGSGNVTKVQFIATHNIYELFEKLKYNRRKEIKQEVIKLDCTVSKWNNFLKRIKRAKQNSGRNNTKGKNGDAVNYRYLVVEGKGAYKFDINTLVKFVEVLYTISCKSYNNENLKMKKRIQNKRKLKFPVFSSPALDNKSQSIIS